MIEALLFLFIKHFICDFPLQTPNWMYAHKGKYGHLGGISHALVHAIGTLIVLSFWLGSQAFLYAALDFVVHYHIDWIKVNVEKHYKLNPTNNVWFWSVLGFDQLLHHLTYFLIVILAFG